MTLAVSVNPCWTSRDFSATDVGSSETTFSLGSGTARPFAMRAKCVADRRFIIVVARSLRENPEAWQGSRQRHECGDHRRLGQWPLALILLKRRGLKRRSR